MSEASRTSKLAGAEVNPAPTLLNPCNGATMVFLRLANALIDDLTRLAVGVIWRGAVLALFLTPIWWVVK